MNEKKILSDYYPLQYDISDWNIMKQMSQEAPGHRENHSIEEFLEKASTEGMPCAMNAEELVQLALQNKLNAFQGMVLLIKNAFEGHVNLTHDMNPENLLDQGTYLVDLNQDNSQSLVFDFFSQFDLYYKGIKAGWDQLISKYEIKQDISFDSLLHFILANQLFKFPVSFLEIYDVTAFTDLPENQRDYFLRQYQLGMVMLENLGNYHLIRTVNTIYNERFRELILKIRSKEEVLSQLDTKLMMANDPEVQSERELEKKYFDFLVATRIKMGLSWSPARIIPFCTDAGGRNSQQFAIYRLKQLYRAISKNCREAHTDPGNDEGYPVLKELFIDASRIYNEIRSNEYDYFIHYYMLINILNQVVLLRQCNTLTVSFIDYTGLHGQQPLPEISKEFINRTKSQIEDMVICRKSYENTSFKIKNICDEELAMLHYDFLVKHSKYLDEQIRDLLNQINACISSKSEKNEKRSNIK